MPICSRILSRPSVGVHPQEEQSRLDKEVRARGEEPLPPPWTAAGARARAVRLLRWLRVLPPAPAWEGSDEEGSEGEEEEGSDGDDFDADEADDAFDRDHDGGPTDAELAASGLKVRLFLTGGPAWMTHMSHI